MITCTFEKGYTANLRHAVVHAIVEDNGKLLLVKRTGDILETGKWGLPGGFLDRNETLEEGILRELKEETGWQGEVITLFRINSLPNRPHEDRENIAIDFIVKSIKQISLPDHESSKVEWIPIEKLNPLHTFAFDHGETIGYYLKYRKKPFLLPIVDNRIKMK